MLDVKKELPELPYDKKALAPLITEETFDYHYGKHHAAYVKNLNGLIKDSAREEKSVKELILEGHQKKKLVYLIMRHNTGITVSFGIVSHQMAVVVHKVKLKN